MKPLLSYELKKILKRPFTLVVCFACIGICVLIGISSAMEQMAYAWGPDVYGSYEAIPENELARAQNTFGLVGPADGALVFHGPDAIRIDKENTKPFEGVWDSERLAAMASEYLAYKNDPSLYTDELDMDAIIMREWTLGEEMDGQSAAQYSAENPIYKMKPEFEYGKWQEWQTVEYLLDDIVLNADGDAKSFEEAFPLVEEPAVYEYHQGPLTATQAQGIFVGMLALLMLVAGLSPVFSDEVACRTEPMLLAAKYGRDKLVRAKLLSGLLFALGALAVLTLINVLLCGAFYGFGGYNMPVQLEPVNYSVPFAFTYGEYMLALIGMQALGLTAMAALVLLLSTLFRSAIPVIFTTGVFSFVVMLLSNAEAAVPVYISQTLPPGAAMPTALLYEGLTPGWGALAVPQWALAVLISAAALVLSILAVLRKYRRVSRV
ncbi:MAG TPA: hypothetical protein DEB31_07620, partial [Clostridiales bacterium]|nr:hypothetical protein [Clostridiales bacterium]